VKLPPRLSIAGLMAIVLVSSIGLAALRSGSSTWAGGLYLLTNAIFVLAVVGAVCRGASERAWWLGFALFGLGYMRGPYFFPSARVKLPTTALLELIRPDRIATFVDFDGPPSSYWMIGQCLWSLLAAMLGGWLSHFLFAAPASPTTDIEDEAQREVPPSRPRRRRFVVVGLAGLVALVALIRIVPRLDLAVWAGAVYMLTWVVLGFAALGFACVRGRRRMIWFGAAFFGLGYMVLNRGPDQFEESTYAHLVADEFLGGLRPWLSRVVGGFPAETAVAAAENARIKKVLDQPLPMQFPEATPLKDVVKYIVTATETPDGREVPIYVDPQGLQDADKTMESTIEIDLEGCPLSTTLSLALRQLNMYYYVSDGMVIITSTQSEGPARHVDYYLLLGHCVLAMLSAGLGACVVPLVSNRRVGQPT
jgi:hypothetical protein